MKEYIFAFSKDITDLSNVHYGARYDSSGVLRSTLAYNSTDKISISAGQKYIVTTKPTNGVFYNNDVVISAFDVASDMVLVKIPNNATHVAYSAIAGYFDAVAIYELNEAFPIYGNDVTLNYEKESGQQFFRKKFNGKLTFVKDDYTNIMARPFDESVGMFFFERNGNNFNFVSRMSFVRTDCNINEWDKILQVQPTIVDEYEEVIAGMSKEYNMAKFPLEVAPTTMDKRPCLQVYVAGSDVLSCFCADMWWEQDAEVTTNEKTLLNTYHFQVDSILCEIKLTKVNALNVDGIYGGNLQVFTSGEFRGTLYSQTNREYKIIMRRLKDVDEEGGVSWKTEVTITKYTDNVPLYNYTEQTWGTYYALEEYTLTPSSLDVRGSVNAVQHTYNIYKRFLTNKDTYRGRATKAVPTNDITANNRNYHYIAEYPRANIAEISSNYSETPTEWGLSNNGLYNMPPSILGTYYPLARSTWRYGSLWYYYISIEKEYEFQGREIFETKDVYPLSAVINELLKNIAPSIKHYATEEYSQFLYSENKPIGNSNFDLLITPKSNILVTEYQDPAQKAPITLADITEMLQKTFDCYWYIEDNKFKIEHIQFFKNGGTYAGVPLISFDLTTMTNVRNGKPWAFATSEYKFDKENMPERYEYEWSDDVTDFYKGNPIEIKSNYVQKGNIVKTTISKFVTDLDYCLLNPNAMSMDGFVLLAGRKIEVIDDISYYAVLYLDYFTMSRQNGILGMSNLIPEYLTYDMPAQNIIVNESTDIAKGIKRNKKQDVSIPMQTLNVDTNKLVKTYIGNGQIDNIQINISSRTAKTTLQYDTE